MTDGGLNEVDCDVVRAGGAAGDRGLLETAFG
jgi:hypothetical protein